MPAFTGVNNMDTLLNTLKYFNQNHAYNDILLYLEYHIESDFYDTLDIYFQDLCYDNKIKSVEDLLNDENCILSEFTDLDNLKNMTGVLQYTDHEKLVYLNLETINEIIKLNPETYLQRISGYISDNLMTSLKIYDSSALYHSINDYCYDDYNIQDLIQNIENGFIKNDEILRKDIISFFCQRLDCIA